MNPRCDQFIEGAWIAGSGAPMESLNPATQEILWQGHSASRENIEQAIAAAHQALPHWSEMAVEKRIIFLKAFAEQLKSSQAAFAEIISKETGKPLWEARNEVGSMINKVAISMDAFQARCPEKVHGSLHTRHKPHGATVVLGPYNFPGHLPNGHIIPALLAGNTVIFKSSEYTPLVAEMMTWCWEEVALPKGVFNLVQGGRNVGEWLAGHPLVQGIFFTGSWQTGKALMEQAISQPGKILALEMGGNNPLVVSKIADLKAAALTIVQSAYLTAGQRCTSARRLIVLPEIADALIHELQALVPRIKVGAYTESPEPFMGPLIHQNAAQHLLDAQRRLKEAGGIPLIEMSLLRTSFLSPGLMDVTHVPNRPDEEYFGPFLQLIRVPNFAEAIQEANRTSYGLSAGLLSDSKEEYETFYQSVRAGIINWNAPLTGASSSAPFGGIGKSGNFRPSAYYAADYCSYPVASMEHGNLEMPENLPPGIAHV
jgi:succinylglutamic semialdehyde dehydrogenase